jgi:hypothetical protein
MEGSKMEDEKNERWKELCALAALERDPERLHKLVEEIDHLLQEKQDRLKKRPPPQKA